MEILWWLAPPAAATVLAMLWVAWRGREGRGEVDREVAVRRLAEAMSRHERTPGRARGGAPRRAPEERTAGIAVRRSSRSAGTDRERRAS